MFGQATEKLDAVVHAWSAWMWDMSLHVTWLAVLLWLLNKPLQRTSARLRFVLWSLVLVRLIVPPGLILPTGVGFWLGDWFSQQVEAWSFSPAASTAGDLAAQTELAQAHGAPTTSHVPARDWSSLAFTLWLGFVIAQFVWFVFGWRQIRRWLAQSTPLEDARALQALANAQRRAGIRWAVALRDSGQCTTPLVIGCWRPVILLPTAVRESLSLAELETVLVHELMHMARRDGWWRLAQAILGALYFFHPAVWLARYRLNQLCEEACDEQTVLALAGERRDYAQAIVKAATIIGYQPPYLAMNMVGDGLPVKRRLQRILDPSLTWTAGGNWQRAMLGMLLALVLLPSGYRSPEATPPDRLRQTGLPSVEVSHVDDPSVVTASENTAENNSEAAADQELERQALSQLRSIDLETRLSAYQTLERVGTLNSLRDLEAAFLNRRGTEQDAAKRALDRVWNIIRQSPTESSQTSRLIRKEEES